jgi:subtilase family serine protease
MRTRPLVAALLPAVTLAAVTLAAVILVAGCTGGSPPPATTTTARAAAATPDEAAGCVPDCSTPRMVQVAYGIAPLLARGIDGSGETVTVLVTAPPPGATPPPPPSEPTGTPVANPTGPLPVYAEDLRQDVAAFDRQFALPAPRIAIVTSLAGAAAPWQASVQEITDVEVVHAVAPAAAIRVVLTPASATGSSADVIAGLLAGLRLAVSGTDVAMIDQSLGEHYFTKAQAAKLNSILAGAEARHVTVVAGSGDNGGFSGTTGGTTGGGTGGGTAVKEVSLPAADPLVLSVGGTELTVSAAGGYQSETVWNGQAGGFSESSGASGGGFSHLYARPAYQDGVRGISAMRGVPDVAADADQQGGIATVSTFGAQTAVNATQGTASAAALWAGLIALADQDAHHDLGFVNPAIYRIARSASYHLAFHDITTGNNLQTMPYPGGTAGYQAGPGWDPATGWGSPNAQFLIPLLAA